LPEAGGERQWVLRAKGLHPAAQRLAALQCRANLKAETGGDIDVLYNHYFKSFGVISAGYF
jgi:hypothetical protein